MSRKDEYSIMDLRHHPVIDAIGMNTKLKPVSPVGSYISVITRQLTTERQPRGGRRKRRGGGGGGGGGGRRGIRLTEAYHQKTFVSISSSSIGLLLTMFSTPSFLGR
jgi:hypothetical protein